MELKCFIQLLFYSFYTSMQTNDTRQIEESETAAYIIE